MKSAPKVFGLIQARNEWPLLALSISHALMHHVDEVYVLNHASTDRSIEGLEHLQKLWNNRIHVFHWYDERYWQEAFVNALVMISKASSPDWFYIFDADEFLITQESRSLKSIVNEVDPKYSAIRYEVQNWISTEGFDETALDHYRMLRYRSVVNFFIEMYPPVYADEIFNGNLNFFDMPFPSKVIFRNDEAVWVEAGTHGIKKPVHCETLILNADELSAAHFPLLSRRKLERKVRHGQRLIQDGFPATHGWQSQMIYRSSQHHTLDEFWHSHTITSGSDSGNRTLPSFLTEEGFVHTIEPTLRMLETSLDASLLSAGEQDLSTERPENSPIPIRVIIPLVQNFQSLLLERDKLINERDKLMNERERAIAERDILINSSSWRYTEFIRRIFSSARTFMKSVKNHKQ